MANIYDYDVSQGWGRVKPMLDTSHIEFNTTFNDEGVGYYVHANLALGCDESTG